MNLMANWMLERRNLKGIDKKGGLVFIQFGLKKKIAYESLSIASKISVNSSQFPNYILFKLCLPMWRDVISHFSFTFDREDCVGNFGVV